MKYKRIDKYEVQKYIFLSSLQVQPLHRPHAAATLAPRHPTPPLRRCTPPRCRPHIAPTPLHAAARPFSVGFNRPIILKFCPRVLSILPTQIARAVVFETFFWPPHAPPSKKLSSLSSPRFNQFFCEEASSNYLVRLVQIRTCQSSVSR